MLDETTLARLTALSVAQDGVLGRDQLAGLGFDRHHIHQRVVSGRWTAVGSRVVALSTGSFTFRQRLWVAVLHSGPDAALSGLTAAEAHGLRGFATSTLHTLVPHGSDARRLVDPAVGVTVVPHQSRRLREVLLRSSDVPPHPPRRPSEIWTPPIRQPGGPLVHPVLRPRRLELPEAIVDAAAAADSADRAQLIVISAVQQRLLCPAELSAVVEARSKLARRSTISWAIADVEGGIHSLPERDWSRALRRHRLPAPTRQRRVQRRDGSWYLDADFQSWEMSVEINGSQHGQPGAILRDDHRRNVLGTGGRLVITLSSHLVRERPGAAAVMTAAALLGRGWLPAPPVLAVLERVAAAERIDLATGDWL